MATHHPPKQREADVKSPKHLLTERIKGIIGYDLEVRPGDAALLLRGEKGTEYGIWLPPQLLSQAIIVLSGAYHALVQLGSQRPDASEPPAYQAFGLWKSQVHVSTEGAPGLVLELDGPIQIAVTAGPQEARQLLAEVLKLVELADKAAPKQH
jgi:hypothetical protein